MKQHRTLWRGLGILLALTMGLCLLAATALAETMQTADFTIGDGSDALNRLKYSNPGKVEWDSTTNTLTLKGVNYAVTADIAVKLPANSTIVLEADTTNTIKSTNTDTNAENSYGIYCDGDLTIKGSGTLNVTGGAAEGKSSFGISVENGDLTITSGIVNATGSKNAENAKTCDGINVESCVKIEGGTVTANGDAATNSHGIYAWGVEISGGTVTAVGADGGSSIARSVGIWTQGTVTISGDDTVVTATGGTAQSDSHGIWTSDGNVTITGGTVTVTGSNAEDSYGIRPGTHGGEKITISGGHVIARTLATTATNKSALHVNDTLGGALDLSGYTNYQWCIGPDAAYTISTTTSYTYDATHTYLEIDRVKTVIKGNETADFTGNTATALDLITNNDPSKATWDSKTKTLTLNGVNFTTSADTAVKLPANSTIVLANGTENTITSTFESASDDSYSYGILVEGGDLTIEGGGQLAVKGGTAQYSDGIVVFSGSLTIDSGTVTATGGTASSGSYGVYTDNGVKISGGIVKATGGESGDGSHGIATNRDVTITGGTVIARGGNGGQASYGIQTGSSSSAYTITVTGGTVTAIGGNASERSYGIDSRNCIPISGGHVTAQTLGNTSTEYRSALKPAPDLSAYTGCYWRTGPDDYYYNTAYPYSEAHTYVEFASEGKTMPIINDLPKTGDNSNVLLWIVLLLASGLGVTGTVVYGRRSKYAK